MTSPSWSGFSICAPRNTHANNAKYATLAAVDAVARPIYTAHGFALSFDTDNCQKTDHVRVVCHVHHAAGHAEAFHIDMPCDGKGAKGAPMMTTTHAVASAISYARRYLLSMVFSLCVEKDDDGNAAAGRPYNPAPQPTRPTPGGHADGQDNRFYREPLHDELAHEAEAEAANESDEAAISAHDVALAEAASHGMAALAAAWKKVPPKYQHILEAAKERRFKPRAMEVDAARRPAEAAQ